MNAAAKPYPTLEDAIGHTPLVRLQRLGSQACESRGNVILGKLEGNNPAGSVKDRPAMNMIRQAEARGDIRPGDTLIEATSGNTGIALAMAAAIKGYRMVLIMPEDLSIERAQTMRAFGAELVLTPKSGGMEHARDLAEQMRIQGKGVVLDQFANFDNPRVHFETTGPEIWGDTQGRVTHFVSAMGTTGTITGVSRYLKQQNPAIRIVGVQPEEGSRIPGIRKWPEAYLPAIYDDSAVDELRYVSQAKAEAMARELASQEGLFAGISAAGAASVALQLAHELHDATIVCSSCATVATGICRQACSPHERGVAFLSGVCRTFGGARNGRRRWVSPTHGLWRLCLCALEQPHPGVGGDCRVPRQGFAGAQRRVARTRVCPDHGLYGSGGNTRGGREARNR